MTLVIREVMKLRWSDLLSPPLAPKFHQRYA